MNNEINIREDYQELDNSKVKTNNQIDIVSILLAIVITFIAAFFFVINNTSAQEEVYTRSDYIEVERPRMRRQFWDELQGEPKVYKLDVDDEFDLHFEVSFPPEKSLSRDYRVRIYNIDTNQLIKELNLNNEALREISEFLTGHKYLSTPRLKEVLPAGRYGIEISNTANTGKYIFSLGNDHTTPVEKLLWTVGEMPELRSKFFEVSPMSFLLSIVGAVYFLLMLLMGFLLGSILRKLIKIFTKKESAYCQNIGSSEKLLRLTILILLIIFGISTWSPWVLLLSGFVLYENKSRWCAIYSIFGKNTIR